MVMRPVVSSVLALVALGVPGAAAGQTVGSKTPVVAIQVFGAAEREAAGDRTYAGLTFEATRAHVDRRVTFGGTARARVHGGQSLEGLSRLQLSSRTTFVSAHRVSYANGPGEDVSALAGATSGLAAASTMGLAHQISRRTTAGISYRFDRVSYAYSSGATVANGLGAGLSRVANRYLTLQVGYDFGWSRARSHAAVLQAHYRLPQHEGTTLTLTLRPTTSRGAGPRTTVVAGAVRVDHRLTGTQRVGLGYERSVSLLEVADDPVVANVFSAHLDARVRRLTTVSASVYYSSGQSAQPGVAPRASRLNAALRVILQLTPRTGVFGEYTHVGSSLTTAPGGVGAWSFGRTTVRVGATIALAGYR